MDPGAAKQIIDNGVEESHHRRQMEEKMLEIGRRRSIRRDWMGYSIGIISIIVGGILIYQDHYVVGTIFSGVTILGLVGQFLGEDSNKTPSDNQHSSDEKPKKSSNDD